MSLRTTHILAVVGAVVVFVATAVSWYTHDVSVGTQTGQVAYSSSKSYTLWDLTTLAPVLLVIGAALGAALLLFAPSSSARAAAAVAGLLGLGITAYCVVKCSDFPDLGPTGAVRPPAPGRRRGCKRLHRAQRRSLRRHSRRPAVCSSPVRWGTRAMRRGRRQGHRVQISQDSHVRPEPEAPKITKYV